MPIGDILAEAISWLEVYGFPGFFVVMMLESFGIPMPSEAVYVAGQGMVLSNTATYTNVFLVVLLGKTAGSVISYWVGRFFAGKIKRAERRIPRIWRAQKVFSLWMMKYGSAAVFISRLVGYIRPWSSCFAGIGEISFLPFIFYNILGSAVNILLAMAVMGVVTEIWVVYAPARPYIAALFVLAFVGFWFGLAVCGKGAKSKSQKI